MVHDLNDVTNENIDNCFVESAVIRSIRRWWLLNENNLSSYEIRTEYVVQHKITQSTMSMSTTFGYTKQSSAFFPSDQDSSGLWKICYLSWDYVRIESKGGLAGHKRNFWLLSRSQGLECKQTASVPKDGHTCSAAMRITERTRRKEKSQAQVWLFVERFSEFLG